LIIFEENLRVETMLDIQNRSYRPVLDLETKIYCRGLWTLTLAVNLWKSADKLIKYIGIYEA
jgi:hypothetical protein